MLICKSCEVVLEDEYEDLKAFEKAGYHPKDGLDALGVKKLCCRVAVLTHNDTIREHMNKLQEFRESI